MAAESPRHADGALIEPRLFRCSICFELFMRVDGGRCNFCARQGFTSTQQWADAYRQALAAAKGTIQDA